MASAKNRLSTMTQSEANRLAYKDMKMSLYLFGTFFFYIVVIVGAIVIPSVSVVLDFAAAVAVSALAFGFPGLFYYKGAQRYGRANPMYMKMAYVYMGLAVFNFILGITSTIMNIVGGEGGGE
jgi:glucan phosphoethanolaminetransferase (alkaline phosphatase superfamily)